MTDHGICILTNTEKYPFNNSRVTVHLSKAFESADYHVATEIVRGTGEPGCVIVSGKMKNGFKLEYTGSGVEAVIVWRAEEQ